MKDFEIYNARYNEENKAECEKLIELICRLFGVFTDNVKPRFTTIYNDNTKRIKLYFYGTDIEYKKLCNAYYELVG